MITENPQRRPASAEMAAGWLHRVQQLLGEYTGFTSQFAEALQQTVTRGLPFPDPSWYAESTRILGQQRTLLLDEIRMSAWMPDSAGWDLPAGDAPLVHFAESLADLQQVSCELQRQQDELLPRYLDVSATAARLTSRDEGVMPHIEPLRQQARKLQHQFEQQPWLVAERDVQTQLEGLQALFLLLCEAQRPLPTHATAKREGLSIADLERHFDAVESQWGRRLALAALRGLVFSAAFPGCELRDGIAGRFNESGTEPSQIEPASPAAVTVPDSVALAPTATVPAVTADLTVPPVAEKSVEKKSAPATAEQLQHLLKNFGRTLAPAAPTKGALPVTISVPPTALGTSTAELAALATCSSKLSSRAEMLWPDVSDVQRHSTAKAAEQIRALGWWNLAFALDLAGELLSERSRTSTTFRSELVELLNLAAEAQNAVRVEAEGREVTVAEQDQVFQWMRIICHEHSEGVRIERFMRRDDRANPENNADVSARLHVLGKKIRDRISQERLLRQLELQVRNLKRDGVGTDNTHAGDRNQKEWKSIDQTVRELLGTGLHENHCGMRDLLLPVVDLIPETQAETEDLADGAASTASHNASEGCAEASPELDEFSPEFNRVLNSISMHLARTTAVVQTEAETETADVQYVRERLSGQSIAIVGGVCKPHAAARIQKALKLRELRWLSAGKNDRVCQFETDVRGMSLVVLITKLIGHKHNDIREFCKNQGVPWVQTRVQGGYSVNQLAYLIREQASEYLDAHCEELAACGGQQVGSC